MLVLSRRVIGEGKTELKQGVRHPLSETSTERGNCDTERITFSLWVGFVFKNGFMSVKTIEVGYSIFIKNLLID